MDIIIIILVLCPFFHARMGWTLPPYQVYYPWSFKATSPVPRELLQPHALADTNPSFWEGVFLMRNHLETQSGQI